jgi:pyruvate formate lyase activating enzyme
MLMYDIKGKIHSFETFGTVDGPGIRFVIFLYGCPFKCEFCHNPDTWFGNNYEEYTAQQIFDMIKKYIPYIKKGGITVSGGEPLVQIEFIKELFKMCKKEGLHTAIDTNGYSNDYKKINELMKYTDLVMLSIKHMVDQKHTVLTKKSNVITLNFAKFLSNIMKPTWIRYIVIPKINDNERDLILLNNFLKQLNNVEKIELLPYHKIGDFKWENLGLENTFIYIPPAVDEDIKRAKKILGIE